MESKLRRFLCVIGFHPWQVTMLIITGDAQCPWCAATGIFTPDGIISVEKGKEK